MNNYSRKLLDEYHVVHSYRKLQVKLSVIGDRFLNMAGANSEAGAKGIPTVGPIRHSDSSTYAGQADENNYFASHSLHCQQHCINDARVFIRQDTIQNQ